MMICSLPYGKSLTILSLFVYVVIPFKGDAQFTKEWEVYAPTFDDQPPSYLLGNNKYLKTLETNEGDFVILGTQTLKTEVYGSLIYLMKYNRHGNVIWEYTFEGNYGISDQAFDFNLDGDGNAIIGGSSTTHYQGGFESTVTTNFLLLKVSPNGQFLWQLEYTAKNNRSDYCSSVVIDSLNNIYTVGRISKESGSGILVSKFDPDGALSWSHPVNYHYSGLELMFHGNLLLLIGAGTSPMIYHFTLDGTLIFSKSIEELSSYHAHFDKNGNMYKRHHTGEYSVEKFNKYGVSLWKYHKPTNLPPNVHADEAEDCFIDDIGNVYITGRYYGKGYGNDEIYTNCDILTVRLDSNGIVQWENLYQYDMQRSCQTGQKILVDNFGFTHVLGHQSVEIDGDIFGSRDMVLLTYDHSGLKRDSVYHNGVGNGDEVALNMFIDKNELYIMGWSENALHTYDMNVVKYSHTLSSVLDSGGNHHIKLYPNPLSANPVFISCDFNAERIFVTDIFGRIVFAESNFSCNTSISLHKVIAPGTYILTVMSTDFASSATLIVL